MWPFRKFKNPTSYSNDNTNNRTIYACSIKKSKRRGFWQVKEKVHYHHSFPGFHYLFEDAISKLGFNPLDRQAIYTLSFSTKEFEGYQIKLKKKNSSVEITEFYVEENTLGSSQKEGYLPNELFKKISEDFSVLYLRISKSKEEGMFFLRETTIA